MAKQEDGTKTIATNRKARHRYVIEDRMEAGIELKGSEVKSLREGNCSIEEAYAKPGGREMFLYDMHIGPYTKATIDRPDPTRRRRLLMHRREIDRVIAQCTQRGYTLVPLRLYFRDGWAKVQLGLARNRDVADKRDKERSKQHRNEASSAMARRAQRRGRA